MANTSGALFSTDARGSVGALTYQHAYRRKICRGKPKPTYRRTAAQIAVRNTITKSVKAWQSLLSIQKDLWKQYTNGNGNTGYHAFMDQYPARTLQTLPQYQLPPNHGYCLVGEWLVGELTVGGVWSDP